MKIKYKNPDNLDEFIVEDVDISDINLQEYCIDLQKSIELKNKNYDDTKIWIEVNEEFVLAGI
jgi:hypothetical protein